MALAALSWASSATAAGTFAYRKAIVFHGGPSGVVGGPHASFPVLISLVNDADLQARVSSPSGYDIVFQSEDPATCGGPAPCTLDHEIERWDGATGTLVAWVRVPSLSGTTVIYVCYGNKQVTSSTEAPRAVWDAGYVGVWHLGEQGAGNVNEYRDSSRYGNHGRGGAPPATPPAIPTRVPDGKIGNGQRFDNADTRYDFIDAGDDGTLRMTGNQITLETWVRHGIALPSTRLYGILNVKGYWDGYRLAFWGNSSSCGGPITVPCLAFSLPGATDVLITPPTAPLGPNQWHHVVATYNGLTMSVFVDGVSQGSRAKTGNISPTVGGESLRIGQADQPEGQAWSGELEGDLDELRISRVARPASWIATQFRNQSSPGAFYTVGAEAAGSYSPTTPAVNYRSIGTNAADLSAGTASAASGAITVTVGTGLPANIGLGDQLDFIGAPVETLFILSRDSATQVTVQNPAASAHIDQTYTIKRAYNTLQAWSTARQGDLVAGNRREVGVAYNDLPFVPFTAVTIGELGVTKTDPARYMKLTAAPSQRHLGRAGTGVVLDNGMSPLPAVRIIDDFASVEWFEIKGGSGPGAHGIEFASNINPANLATVANNVIHDTGSDGVRLGDPDSIVDIHNNIIYGASYGIHFPVDMTADARVNVFNNTIYGCKAATGPSGVKSDVRQKSLRIDLRNNIAHSNANGDFGVSPFFDRGYFCTPGPGCIQIASGGVLGPNEYLADRSSSRNFTLTFANVGTSCLYLGSASQFRGVNMAVATPGVPLVPEGVDLLWSYSTTSGWTSLETGPFNDGAGSFVWEGPAYWPNDPADWAMTSVSGSPSLYYVRACLASGGYSTYPVEEAITRVDVAIASRNDLASDISGRPHSALFAGQTGLDSVSLPSVGFFNTTTGAENLHINVGSAAQDFAADLTRVFSGDIDGAVRAAPWDIGADDVLAGSGPDLSIDKIRTSPDPVVPGDPVSYRMTVTNIAGSTLTSMTVTDTLPPGIRVPVYTPSMGSYDPASGIWTGLTLASGQSVTLDLLGTLDPWARGTLVNSARVVPPDGVIDPTPENDFDTVGDVLAPSADLALDKTGDLYADLGGLLIYTLTVTNNGPSAATGVVLTDPLPPHTEFDWAMPSQGTCSFDGSTRILTCDLLDVPSPGIATVTLRVRPMELGTLTNTASVAAPEDPAGNNSPPCQTTVQIPSDGVRFFTVTSTSEMNVLEWLNPTASYGSTEILVRTDHFPTGPGEPGTTSLYNAGTAGAKDRLPHPTGPGTNGQTFYYAAFVHLSPSGLSSGRLRTGRPLDTTGPVKWAFSTGGFSVTPPTVGGAGIIATSNDMAVHAMARGAASPPGGEWPSGWLPFQVGGPVQSRSPVVPIQVNKPVVFLGAQDGFVYALDGALGGAAPTPPWLAPHDLGAVVQAAPAGIFTAFHGIYDYLLVGTRDATANADNVFVALNPSDGTFAGSFNNGGGANGIGMISGMATVVYGSPPRVYFASHAKVGGSATTLWCLELGPPTVFATCTGWAHRALGDIESSPVLRQDRIYVGNDGTVYSIDAASGTLDPNRWFVHGDGQVKGFVFPDRNSDDIYFATDNRVWAFSDSISGMTENFPTGGLTLEDGPRPSSVLFVPASRKLYVGGSNGRLYEIDVTTVTQRWVQLGDGKAVVGAPSYDWENSLVHVGTEAGIFYAVSVPLPPP